MSDTSPTLRELVAVNLRYDAGMASLNVRAIAQLLAKVLYAEGSKVSKPTKELQKAAAKALGIGGISLSLVEEGLRFLVSIHLARESGNRWLLTDKGFEDVGKDVASAARARASALERHFPQRLDKEKLEAWFLDAVVEFYRIYGSQWAAALARRAPRAGLTASVLANLLDAANKRHGLSADAEVLETGFRHFLTSDEPEDERLQWSIGQSLLASQLVAANVGPDPMGVKDFRDSVLILDTNVLVAIALQVHSRTPHIKGLAKALKQIGATVGRLECTGAEYVRLIENKRPAVTRAAERYKPDVLAHSGDEFLHAALSRGCRSKEDFDAFFDDLLSLPSRLSEEMTIDLLDTPHIVAAVDQGMADETLKNSIAEAWSLNRRTPKSRKAVEHDAAVVTVVEMLRADGQKCAVLTEDRSMVSLGAQRAGPNANPSWLLFDGLLQILAVDGAGPGLDPGDFAPLLASIIRNQVQPAINTYTAEDLVLMAEIEDRCANLPSEKVQDIAVMVARERYKGTDRLDGELQLSVRHAFQAGKMKLEEDLQTAEATVRGHETQLDLQRRRSLATSAELIQVRTDQRRRRIHLREGAKTFVGLGAGIVFLILGYRFAGEVIEDGALRDYVQLVVLSLAPAFGTLGWVFKKVIPGWRGQLARARTDVEAEVAAIGDESTA